MYIYIYVHTYIHYITLHCITLHYIPFHSIPFRSISFHSDIHTTFGSCMASNPQFPSSAAAVISDAAIWLSMRHFSWSTCEGELVRLLGPSYWNEPWKFRLWSPQFLEILSLCCRSMSLYIGHAADGCLYGLYHGGCFSLFPPFIH